MNNPWFLSSAAKTVDLQLFCLPYAGGTAMIYRDWVNHLPPTVQLIRVELPGRGARLKEAPFDNLPSLVEALTEALLPVLQAPFVFFGHSMGAMIAFETARRLQRDHGRIPQLLMVSGRRALHIPDPDRLTYNLPTDKFIAELHEIGGSPKEALEHPGLMEVMLPLLRADFQLVETYQYTPGSPLECPITAFGGLQDKEENRDLLLPWKVQTNSNFRLRMLPGDHFFLRSSQSLLLRLVTQELIETIMRGSKKNGRN